MYILGWSQKILFNQKIYDQISYEETGLICVRDLDGSLYIGVEVHLEEEKGVITEVAFNDAHERLKSGVFGILKNREPVFYQIKEFNQEENNGE